MFGVSSGPQSVCTAGVAGCVCDKRQGLAWEVTTQGAAGRAISGDCSLAWWVLHLQTH